MKEMQDSVESRMWGAKRMSLEKKIDALQQLVLQRYQALVAISSIAFAVSGVIISVRNDLLKNESWAMVSAGLFAIIALVSLGRHLFLLREDIRGVSERIKELPSEDWSKSLREREFSADWWPESLYGLLVFGVLLFVLALF